MIRPFIKMNGLGNDFVVLMDGPTPYQPTVDDVRAIASRKRGIGCDQLISLEASTRANIFMRIWNADGGEIAACGNAARCVAWLLLQASGRDTATIETSAGILLATRAGHQRVTVDMGAPGLDWRDIPLAWALDTNAVELRFNGSDLGPAGCVSIGNPHAVFFVPDAEAADVAWIGAWAERHPLFPDRTNVGFAQIKSTSRIRLRVWERGVGITLACGTGACAALVAAHRRGLVDRSAILEMDGGELSVEWRESDDHLLMTGPVALEFTGHLPQRLETVA